MTKLLLDTSVIIDFTRKAHKQETLLYQLSQEDLYISIVTHTELYSGKKVWADRHAQKELEELFSSMYVQPLNQEISKTAGSFRARYHVHVIDAIIAATARYYDIELVTLNIKDFEKIEGIRLLDTSSHQKS